MNRHARPVKYQSKRDYQIANFASRTMRMSGLVILAFIVWHLADLTFGVVNSEVGKMVTHSGDEEPVKAVYASVVHSFSRTPVALFYVFANVLLGIHLFHGAWSIFQSFGWNNPRFQHMAPRICHWLCRTSRCRKRFIPYRRYGRRCRLTHRSEERRTQ